MNQSKQRGRADNTIWARGMTTEPVQAGSGLKHGGGSSRGRDRLPALRCTVDVRDGSAQFVL